jgi:quinol monooxygenase YgiN
VRRHAKIRRDGWSTARNARIDAVHGRVLRGNGRYRMSVTIVSVDSSAIREGKLEELKNAMKELVEFVDANEPRPVAYNVYFEEDGTRMTVVQVHPDSASMEFHMDVAGAAFPKLSDFLTLLKVDIYGEPSDQLLAQMRRKARALGNAPVIVHALHAGFTRLAAG